MKTLLFAGSSLFAGDAIVWNQYCDEYGLTNREYPPTYIDIQGEKNSVNYHWMYKRKFNLASQCSKILNTAFSDISVDGFSNTRIALNTVKYVSALTEEECKHLHVVIGWDDVGRIIKYHNTRNEFMDLSVWWIDQDPWTTNFLSTFYRYSHDHDFLLEYMESIILVESYLKSKNITYTFMRGNGSKLPLPTYPYKEKYDEFKKEFPKTDDHDRMYDMFEFTKSTHFNPIIDNFTDNRRWYVFDEESPGWNGDSWIQYLYRTNPKFYISEQNHHPNLETVIDFAKKFSLKIECDM
jgi:hypothetical protein